MSRDTEPSHSLPVLRSETLKTQRTEILDDAGALGVPEAELAPLLISAEPAIERRCIITGESAVTRAVVSQPPYRESEEVGISVVDRGGYIGGKNIEYQTAPPKGKAYGHIGMIGPDTLWAPTAEEFKLRLEAYRRRDAEMQEFAEQHFLGRGGLLLENSFGGIDIGRPEETAKHLVMRTIIARKAGLREVDELVEIGILHPMLAEMVGEKIAEYMTGVNKFLDGLEALPAEARAGVAEPMLTTAVEQGVAFVEEQARTVVSAANVYGDPDNSKRAVELLKDVDSGGTSSSSQKQAKLPFGNDT